MLRFWPAIQLGSATRAGRFVGNGSLLKQK
jgi:hypothetical protein